MAEWTMTELRKLATRGMASGEYFREACGVYDTVMAELCEQISATCSAKGMLLHSLWLEFSDLVQWRIRNVNDYAKEKDQKVNEFSLNFVNKFHEKFLEHEKIFTELKERLQEQLKVNEKAAEKVQQYRGDYQKLSEHFGDLKHKHEELKRENERLNELNNALKMVLSGGKSISHFPIHSVDAAEQDAIIREELIKQRLHIKNSTCSSLTLGVATKAAESTPDTEEKISAKKRGTLNSQAQYLCVRKKRPPGAPSLSSEKIFFRKPGNEGFSLFKK